MGVWKLNVTRFGALIRERRKLLGFTQKQIAERIGKDASLISQWERGQLGTNFPDPATVAALEDILSCSFEDLADAYGYQFGRERKEVDPDVDLFTSLAEGIEWEKVPEPVKEMIQTRL